MSSKAAMLIVNPLGVLALADSEVQDFKPFPKDVQARSERFSKILKGELVDEVKAMLSSLTANGFKDVMVSPSTIIEALARENREVKFSELDRAIDLEELFVRKGFVDSIEEYRSEVKQVLDRIVAEELKEAVARRDMMIVHAVHVLEDLDKQINMFYTRCREWYGLHFPELAEIVDDLEDYMRIVAEFGSRKNFDEKRLREIIGPKKAREVMERAERSVGADLSPEDEEQVKEVAREGLRLIKLRREQERYIEELMSAEAPNISATAGPILGAKLISMAGGLEKLAKLPASTIQVLGAEKALFRFFRTGRGAPKHGILFQSPLVHGSPKHLRGKIARALAAIIAIAAKIDYFTREDRGAELREKLEKRL
ncbi:MAG: C/D box methylation guide ribonucleoprotein complex aNOP56 subunit, partial [Thaumarchaeota archaeon]|nr:C/D box methylation guide ribonucleoprotein complex aNOP56 subunit [Nitrososphaerota archaeon]